MEFRAQAKKVLPLIMLIDTSSSMRGNMKELNQAAKDMLDTLKGQESLRAEIHVSFITFGNGGARLYTPLTPVSEIEFGDFIEGGMTPLGGALKIAKEMIEDRNIVPSNSYRPTVVILSDGGPNDLWEGPFMEFVNKGRSKKCERMSLGIGSGYAYQILEEFSSEGKVHEAKDASSILDFFKFVTMTMKEKSISSNPNKKSLKAEEFLAEIFGNEKITNEREAIKPERSIPIFEEDQQDLSEFFN